MDGKQLKTCPGLIFKIFVYEIVNNFKTSGIDTQVLFITLNLTDKTMNDNLMTFSVMIN